LSQQLLYTCDVMSATFMFLLATMCNLCNQRHDRGDLSQGCCFFFLFFYFFFFFPFLLLLLASTASSKQGLLCTTGTDRSCTSRPEPVVMTGTDRSCTSHPESVPVSRQLALGLALTYLSCDTPGCSAAVLIRAVCVLHSGHTLM